MCKFYIPNGNGIDCGFCELAERDIIIKCPAYLEKKPCPHGYTVP
jgi:hypothetical protein